MIVKVGTLVLCHLIISNTGTNQTEKKIEKVPGIVKEITEAEDIQMVDDTYAVKKKKYLLLVEPKEKDRLFQVSSDACAPVVEESTHLEITRRKLEQKKKNEEIKKEQDSLKSVKKDAPSSKQAPRATPETEDKEKADLLKQLE